MEMPRALAGPLLEIESIGKACLRETGGRGARHKGLVQIQSVEPNITELYWHIINGTFQIDIDSKKHTVDICGLRQLGSRSISSCAGEFVSLFQVLR